MHPAALWNDKGKQSKKKNLWSCHTNVYWDSQSPHPHAVAHIHTLMQRQDQNTNQNSTLKETSERQTRRRKQVRITVIPKRLQLTTNLELIPLSFVLAPCSFPCCIIRIYTLFLIYLLLDFLYFLHFPNLSLFFFFSFSKTLLLSPFHNLNQLILKFAIFNFCPVHTISTPVDSSAMLLWLLYWCFRGSVPRRHQYYRWHRCSWFLGNQSIAHWNNCRVLVHNLMPWAFGAQEATAASGSNNYQHQRQTNHHANDQVEELIQASLRIPYCFAEFPGFLSQIAHLDQQFDLHL